VPARARAHSWLMKRVVLALLGLLAFVPLLGAACTEQTEEVSNCVDRIAARGSGAAPKSVDGIAREVERLRRLQFRRLPKPEYVRQAEMNRRIRAEFERTPGRAIEASERALIALGAIPRGTDLKKLARDQLAGEVAGYYDPRTTKLVVLSDSGHRTDGAFERVTLSHELDHAVTDQRLGLPGDPKAAGPPEGGEDADTAESALVEGDATLLMAAFASANLSPSDALSVLGSVSAAPSGSLPHYLEASEVFPYFEGESFVCHLYRHGGWKAVNAAYDRPPASTAQVLFPARYDRRERPMKPPPAASPGPGWQRFYHSAVGAADLLWLFEAPGDKESRALSQPRRRAAAWGGGDAVVWTKGPRTVLAMTLVERGEARPRLCGSMRAWAKAAGKPASAVRCVGRIVRATLRA
jgi:hypothetical protein